MAEPSAVAPEKGRVEESGKFVPAERATVTDPDPAKRLAALGVELKGDTMKIGEVAIDRANRTATFPAKINARDGVIEYGLVHATGKRHEALLVTEAQPRDIHLACLLLGGGSASRPPAEVRVEVQWETNGPPRKLPLEDLIAFSKGHPEGESGGSLAPGAWTYTGSQVDAAGFVASREGSIISLIHDDAALVNNPRPSREDDTLHVPNAKAMPPLEAAVRVVLKFHSPKNP
jgi:hypothetical protein